MSPLKKIVSAGILFTLLLPLIANAGLYSSDYNDFSNLKKKLTDFKNYRYAALAHITPNGDNFESYIVLAKTYADILEKDMGIKIKLYETDLLNLRNIESARSYAITQINRKSFEANDNTCSVAATFFYPSTAADILRIIGPNIVIPRDDPALHSELITVSKKMLSDDFALMMRMCDSSKFRKQNNAFRELLVALEGEKNYITSTAFMNMSMARSAAASAERDAQRAAAEKKALEEHAAKVKKYEQDERARDARIIAERQAEKAEKDRQAQLNAQLREEARLKVLASRTPEQVQRDEQVQNDRQHCDVYAKLHAHAATLRDQGYSEERTLSALRELKQFPGHDNPSFLEPVIKMVFLAFPDDSPGKIYNTIINSCVRTVAKQRLENRFTGWDKWYN